MDTILPFKGTSNLEYKPLHGEMYRTPTVYNQHKVFQFSHIIEAGEYKNHWEIFTYK